MWLMYGSVSVLYNDEYLTCPVYAVGDDALKMYFDGLKTDLTIQQKLFAVWDEYTGLTKSKKEVPEHVDGDVWRRLDVTRIGRFSTNLQNVVFAAKIATPIRYLFECSVLVDEATGVPLHTLQEMGTGYKTKQGYSCFMLENNTTDPAEIANGGIYGCYKTEFGCITEIHITTSMMRLSLSLADNSIVDSLGVNDIATMFKKLQFKANGGYGGNTQTKVRTGLAKYAPEYLGFEYEQKQTYTAETFGDEYLLYDDIDSVIAAHPQKNYQWIHDRRYEIVTPDNFEEILKEFYTYDGVIAIDTETTGLNVTYRSCNGEDAQLVGICLSKEVGTGYYFPLQMTKITNLCDGDHKYFMEAYMRKFLTVRKFVTHNVQFDWKVFYIYGINLNVVFDTMIAFGLTEHAQSAAFEIGLKSLALRILGLEMFELDDFVKNGDWSKSGMRFSDLPYELCRRYAPTDADMTLALYYYLQASKLLEKYGAEYIFQVEIQFAKAAAYSEFYGYPVNLETLPKLSTDLKTEVAEIYKKMVDIVGYDFNPRSQPQVVKILYDELKYPTIEGARSTKKDILKELKDRTDFNDQPLYPLAGLLLTYRQLSGVISSFIDNRDKYINSDGIIHPSVNALGARTGRVSIKDPNYQSYNDTVKKNIVPRNGYKMWDSDFSQIEYRVLASMSKEKFLMDAFADWDMDYHTLQASRMFGVPYAAAVGAIRQQAKRVNFALPYGMGDEELGRQIFGARNKENTKKAAKLRDLYFEGQDNVRRFFDVVRDNGVKNGFTTTLFGRKRFYPKGSASTQKIRRQAGNAVIQGCLHGDTHIQTKEYGIVRICDVVNEHLYIWDGEQWTEGDITYSGYKQKCVVTFSGGLQIVCSPIHKFLVKFEDGVEEFVECRDLVSSAVSEKPHKVLINKTHTASWHVKEQVDNAWEMGVIVGGIMSKSPKFDDISAPVGYEHIKNYAYSFLPDVILRNTEVLRGFLHGFFGGYDRVTIAASDFSHPKILASDIQKALLFFGVRSKIKVNDKGSKVIIKKRDTIVFASTVCSKDILQKPISECLTVKSVEITDQSVRMYDVCNTERGYYVADGVITHNTAADIYKIAVVRVFQMICAKGWLGKVLLDGFIHDEILGEVSTDINFDEFIACWREAFEVPVDGFCKLYAGFGIGNSWYMAKKQDLHPMFIQELIDTATGRTWDGDGDKYINEVIVEGFEQHRIRRVREYLQTVSKGEIINPVMSSLLEDTTTAWIMDCVKKDREGTRQTMSTVLGWEVEDQTLDNKKKPCGIKKIGDWIKVFCHWQGLDASQIDLKDAAETEMPKDKQADTSINVNDVEVEMSDMSDAEFAENCISTFGFHITPDKLLVDLRVFTQETAEFLVKSYCELSGTYQLCIVQMQDGAPMQVSETQYYVNGGKLVALQSYIKMLKSNRRVI